MNAMSVTELARLQSVDPDLRVLDVRRDRARKASGAQIGGSSWRDPAHWLTWKDEIPTDRRVVVYCAHGEEIGQGLCAALRVMGVDAAYLAGGFSAWQQAGLATQPLPAGSRWVTRERPKIDRIACPWLITRFIDQQAEFLYVPAGEVLRVARDTGAIPFDIPDVEFSHVGERCSFDAFLDKYQLSEPALLQLATIVRGADTARFDLAPQAAGLFALSLGLSAHFPDDHDLLQHGLVLYDALYAWCLRCQTETHNWPPQAA